MANKLKLETIVVRKLRSRTKQKSVFRVEANFDGTHMVCTTCGYTVEGTKIVGRDPKEADKAALEMMRQARVKPTVVRQCPVCTKRLRDERFPLKPLDAK